MSARSLGASIMKPAGARAVHVKISPRTRNTRDSREILRVLKRFGEVVSFQNLQYERADPAPHTLVAVFAAESAAARLIAACPMGVSVAAGGGGGGGAGEEGGRAQEFTLTADLSGADHVGATRLRAQYWGYKNLRRNFAEEALHRTVPVPAYSTLGHGLKNVVGRIARRNLDAIAKGEEQHGDGPR